MYPQKIKICQHVTSVMLTQPLCKSWDHYTHKTNTVRSAR